MAFFNSAAKKAFDAYKKENGSDKKLPRISELNAEYAMLLERLASACNRQSVRSSVKSAESSRKYG